MPNNLDPTNIDVYHGSWSSLPPHRYERQNSFHAGTLASAYERIENINYFATENLYKDKRAEIHHYQIRSRPSMLEYDDPQQTYEPDHIDMLRAPEENNTNIIYKYRNRYEDKNSTSFVIPSKFVVDRTPQARLMKAMFPDRDVHQINKLTSNAKVHYLGRQFANENQSFIRTGF